MFPLPGRGGIKRKKLPLEVGVSVSGRVGRRTGDSAVNGEDFSLVYVGRDDERKKGRPSDFYVLC